MSLSAYIIDFWPDEHSCTAYLDSIGQEWALSGTHHWETYHARRHLGHISSGDYDSGYNPSTIDLFNDHSISAYQFRFQEGLTYNINKVDENGGNYYWLRLMFADPTLANTSWAYLKMREDQKLIVNSPNSNNPAIISNATTYAAASAAIVTESISGLALIPETNYVESLSALIDNHNGTWIAPASGDYKITNGNWYPYDKKFLHDSVSSVMGITAYGEEREYVRTLESHNASYDDDAGYNYIYDDLDLDSLTSTYDWLIIGMHEPQGSIGEVHAETDYTDYKPYHMPMVYYPDGRITESLKYWYDVGNWLRRDLPIGEDYEIKQIMPNIGNTYFNRWAKEYHESGNRYQQEIRVNDPATANSDLWVGGAPTDLGLTGIETRRVWEEIIDPSFNCIMVKIAKGERDSVLNSISASYHKMETDNFPAQPHETLINIYAPSNSSTASYNDGGTPAVEVEISNLKFDVLGMYTWQAWYGVYGSDSSDTETFSIYTSKSLDGYHYEPEMSSIITANTWGNVKFEDLIVKRSAVKTAVRCWYDSSPDTARWQQSANYEGGSSKGLIVNTCNFSQNIANGFYYNKNANNWVDFNPAISANGDPIFPLSAWSITNSTFNDNGKFGCFFTGIPKNSVFYDNDHSRNKLHQYGDRAGAFYADSGGLADEGGFTLSITGNTFMDDSLTIGVPRFDISNNEISRTVGVDDYDKANYLGLSIRPQLVYDYQPWSYVRYNNMLKWHYQPILIEGTSPSSAYSANQQEVESYVIGDLPGLVKYVNIHDNLFTKQSYINKTRGDTSQRSDNFKYGMIWFSDCSDINYYNNVCVGQEFQGEGYQYGTALDGTPVTGTFSVGYILGSSSAINIYDNKLGYLSTALRLSFTDDAYRDDYPYSYPLDGANSSYKGAGQLNDISITGNTFYQISQTLLRFYMYSPEFSFDTTIASVTSNQLDSITDWDAQLSVINSDSLTGLGDNQWLHDGKSKGLNILDNLIIHDDNFDYWDDREKIIATNPWRPYYPTDERTRYNHSNRFIYFYMHRDSSYDNRDSQVGDIAYRAHFDIKSNPKLMAEMYFWGDDNSEISNNVFYGEYSNEKDLKCINWIVYEDDPVQVIADEYPATAAINRDSYKVANSSLIDPILDSVFSSVSADRWDAWKDASSDENWWFYYTDQSYAYSYTSGPAAGSIYLYDSQYFFYPYIAQHGLNADIDRHGYMSISGWLEYLNTASTGMRGTGNDIDATMPPLSYEYDPENPTNFLSYILIEGLSAAETAEFEDGVIQYKTHPRETVLIKNETGSTITEVYASSLSNDFIVNDNWSVSGASIPNNEYFQVSVSFNPQSVASISGDLEINYKIDSIDKVSHVLNCMHGVSIEIPTANYYVATTGSDAWAGDINNPFKTIEKAFGMCSSGELIYIREGEYDEHFGQYSGGISANVAHDAASDWTWNITTAAYPGEIVSINRQGSSPTSFELMAFFFGKEKEKYLTFEDIAFDGSGVTGTLSGSCYVGSCSWHSSNIKFWNCDFKNRHDPSYPTLDGTPRSFNSLIGVSTTGIIFDSCKFHDCDEHLIYMSSSDGSTDPTQDAVGPRSAINCQIINNEFYNSGMNLTGEAGYYQGYGIHGNSNNTVSVPATAWRQHQQNNLVSGNNMHDISSGAILLGGNFGSTAENNVINNCHSGILDYYSACENNVFTNNTIMNCYYGIRLNYSSFNATIQNNIIVDCTNDYYEDTIPKNPTFIGNIFSDDDIVSYGYDMSKNHVLTDPELIDIDGNVFIPSLSSSAKNKGTFVNSSIDYYNTDRIANDIGAVKISEFESSNGNNLTLVSEIDFSKEVWQYRTYPRETVQIKNNSNYEITNIKITIPSLDFILWEPGSLSPNATIQSGESFHVMVDFRPQSIGLITGSIQISYDIDDLSFTEAVSNCMRGTGIAIPEADYYVSTTGSNANSGTELFPLQTMNEAFAQATAGDMIFVREGIYDETITGNINNSTANNWDDAIRMVAYPGEEVVISPSGDDRYCAYFTAADDKYFSLEDLILDGSRVSYTDLYYTSVKAFAISNRATNGRLWNCEVKNYYVDGLSAASIDEPVTLGGSIGSSGCEILYCDIHDVSRYGLYLSSYDHGSYTRQASACTFKGNYFHHLGRGTSSGYKSYSSYGFHCNNENNGLDLNNNEFSDNLIDHIGSAGIVLAGLTNSKIWNNIFINSKGGIWANYVTSLNNEVYNNTIINCYQGIRINSTSTGDLFYNNIIQFGSDSSYDIYDQGAISADIKYNIYSVSHGVSSISADNFAGNTGIHSSNYSYNKYGISTYYGTPVTLDSGFTNFNGAWVNRLSVDFFGIGRTLMDLGAVDSFHSVDTGGIDGGSNGGNPKSIEDLEKDEIQVSEIGLYVEKVQNYTNFGLYDLYYSEYEALESPVEYLEFFPDMEYYQHYFFMPGLIDHKWYIGSDKLSAPWAYNWEGELVLGSHAPVWVHFGALHYNQFYDNMFLDIANQFSSISKIVNAYNVEAVHSDTKTNLDNLWENYIEYEKSILDSLEKNHKDSETLLQKLNEINSFRPKINTIKNIYNLDTDLVSAYLINSKTKNTFDISESVSFDNDLWKLKLDPIKNIIPDYKLSLKDKFKIVIMSTGITLSEFEYLNRMGIKLNLSDIDSDPNILINNIVNAEIVFDKKYIIENYILDGEELSIFFNKKMLKKEIKNVTECIIYPNYFEKIYIDISFSVLHDYLKTNLPMGKEMRENFVGTKQLGSIYKKSAITVVEPNTTSKKEEIW